MSNKYTYLTQTLTAENDNSFYLLGAFMTDGCISNRNNGTYYTFISSIDQEWIEQIRDQLCPMMPVRWNTDTYRIAFYCPDISRWLMKYECVPNKTLLAKMPAIPEQYLPDFIRGCIDGDGSIGWSYNKSNHTTNISKCGSFHLTSSASNFITGLHNILTEKEYKHTFYTRTNKISTIGNRTIIPKNPHYGISAGGTSAANFLKWVYYPNHRISMKRKNKLAQEVISHYENKLSLFRGGIKYHTKLNANDVIDIKRQLNEGISAIKIGKQYNVSQSNVLAIKHGKTWTHIK